MDDVIIVGASLAGLLTGAMLIQRGYRVRLLEREQAIGGRIRATEHKGFTVDHGLYLFRDGGRGALARAMEATGIPWQMRPTARPQVYQDFNFVQFPASLRELLTTELLPRGDRLRLLPLLLRMRAASPAKHMDVTLEEWLKPHKVSLALYQFLEMFAAFGLTCPDIRRVSAGEFFEFLQGWMGYPGYTYPGSGVLALTSTLSARIQQNGYVQLSTAVERLLLTSGLVTGLQTAGSERYYARAYILAIPPPSLLKLLDPLALSDVERDTARRMVPSAGIVWQIGTKVMVSNVRSPIVTVMPPSVGYFVSNLEPLLAPPGRQIATWFYPLPVERLDDAAYVDQETRWLKATVEEMFPRLRPSRAWERVLVKQRVDSALLQADQHRQRRLPQQLARMANCFLVGDFVQAQGVGQDIGCQAALNAAEMVDRYLSGK